MENMVGRPIGYIAIREHETRYFLLESEEDMQRGVNVLEKVPVSPNV